MILLAVVQERANLSSYFAAVGLIAVLFASISIAVGYAVPRVAGVDQKQAVACAFEIGIHNSALAIVIALTVLDSTAMAVPASVYVIAVWLPSLAFGLLLRKGQRRALQPEIGAGAAQGDATPTH